MAGVCTLGPRGDQGTVFRWRVWAELGCMIGMCTHVNVRLPCSAGQDECRRKVTGCEPGAVGMFSWALQMFRVGLTLPSWLPC